MNTMNNDKNIPHEIFDNSKHKHLNRLRRLLDVLYSAKPLTPVSISDCQAGVGCVERVILQCRKDATKIISLNQLEEFNRLYKTYNKQKKS